MCKKILAFFLIILFACGNLRATPTHEGAASNAQPIVLYGKTSGGALKALKTDTDGNLEISGGGSTLTTKGDLQTYSTVPIALAVGTNGQCLLADSTQPTGLKWGACSGGSALTFLTDSSTTGHVTYVGCSDDIATTFAAATAGDTLMLGSCTYTVSTEIAVNKAISIVGQGDNTILTPSGLGANGIFKVTADNVYLRGFRVFYSGNTPAMSYTMFADCSGGTVCNNINVQNVMVNYTSTADPGGSAPFKFLDAGGTVRNVKSRVITALTGSSQLYVGIFKYVQSTAEADTNLYVYDSTFYGKNNGVNTGQFRSFMNWNNGGDESAANTYIHAYNVNLKAEAPNNGSEDTEAFQNQGNRAFTYFYGGSVDGYYSGGAGTNPADIRCHDGARCYFYASNIVHGLEEGDTSGGVTYGLGYIYASGIQGDQPDKTPTSSSSPDIIRLTGAIGGDKPGTGSQTGLTGGGGSITGGAGGTATAATTTATAGPGGSFTLTAGAGGAETISSSTTNVGGVGGSYTIAAGNGGAASGAATTNTGGAAGHVNIYPGVGGTGTTTNGNDGYVRILSTAAGTKTGRGVSFGQASCSTGATYCFNGALEQIPVSQTITAVGNSITTNTSNIVLLGASSNYVLTSTPSIAAGFSGQILTIRGTMASSNLVTIQDDANLSGSGLLNNGVNITIKTGDIYSFIYDATATAWRPLSMPISGATAIYMKDITSLSTVIGQASQAAGQTIILPAGSFSTTVAIPIAKSVTIKGQGGPGKCATTISTSSNTEIFTVASGTTNVSLEDLCLSSTAAGKTAISIACNASSVCTGIDLKNVGVTTNGTGAQGGVLYRDAGGTVRNLVVSSTSSDSSAYGIQHFASSSQDAATTLNIYNPNITVSSAATTGTAISSVESTASTDVITNVYGGVAFASGAGGTRAAAYATGGANAILNIYGTTLSGTDYDANSASAASVINLYTANLVNSLTNATGTLTYAGRTVSGSGQFIDLYSGDGTQGATTTCTLAGLTSIIVKDGLITSCS